MKINHGYEMHLAETTTSEMIAGKGIAVKLIVGEYKRRCNKCGIIFDDDVEGGYCKDNCTLFYHTQEKKKHIQRDSMAEDQYNQMYRENEGAWVD